MLKYLFILFTFISLSCVSNKTVYVPEIQLDQVENSDTLYLETFILDYDSNDEIDSINLLVTIDGVDTLYENGNNMKMEIEWNFDTLKIVANPGSENPNYFEDSVMILKVDGSYVMRLSAYDFELGYVDFDTDLDMSNDYIIHDFFLNRIPQGQLDIEPYPIVISAIEEVKILDEDYIELLNDIETDAGLEVVTEDYQIINPYPTGKMAYTVPDTMKVGNYYDVTLRITKLKDETVIITDLGDEHSEVIVSDIRVSSVMTAELIDVNDKFKVKSTSTAEQNLEEFGFTEWRWSVKPLKSGDNPLRLIIKVRVFTDQGDYLKDIPVFDKDIKVHSNITWSMKQWLSENWEWFMTTLIIPIFVYFWKRRKKKKGEVVEGEDE